jgi:glycosyltransferase involved in cell wall biosynthesis
MGMPVLSNNIGGTPEIVGKSGLVINIDNPFDGRPLVSMSQVGDDSVNIELLADGIVQAWESRRFEERMDLTIDNCARKYIQEIRNAMG